MTKLLTPLSSSQSHFPVLSSNASVQNFQKSPKTTISSTHFKSKSEILPSTKHQALSRLNSKFNSKSNLSNTTKVDFMKKIFKNFNKKVNFNELNNKYSHIISKIKDPNQINIIRTEKLKKLSNIMAEIIRTSPIQEISTFNKSKKSYVVAVRANRQAIISKPHLNDNADKGEKGDKGITYDTNYINKNKRVINSCIYNLENEIEDYYSRYLCEEFRKSKIEEKKGKNLNIKLKRKEDSDQSFFFDLFALGKGSNQRPKEAPQDSLEFIKKKVFADKFRLYTEITNELKNKGKFTFNNFKEVNTQPI